MLGRKQLQLRLHQGQGRAQLVRRVAGELPLGFKGALQPLEHTVEGAAQTAKLGRDVLAELHLGQIAGSTRSKREVKPRSGLSALPLTK